MVRFGRKWDVVAARQGQNVLGGIRSAAETGVLARSRRAPAVNVSKILGSVIVAAILQLKSQSFISVVSDL